MYIIRSRYLLSMYGKCGNTKAYKDGPCHLLNPGFHPETLCTAKALDFFSAMDPFDSLVPPMGTFSECF